jgi:hypothetical protein
MKDGYGNCSLGPANNPREIFWDEARVRFQLCFPLMLELLKFET